jgi:hypothetical protein
MNLRHAAALALVVVGSGCFIPHYEGKIPDTGVVLDKNTKQPISSATVVMSGEWDDSTTTDGTGRFVIPQTPLFRWTIFPFGDPSCRVDIGAPGYKNYEGGGIGACGFRNFGEILLEPSN